MTPLGIEPKILELPERIRHYTMMSSGEENPPNFEGALFYHVNVNGIRTRITRIILSNSPDDIVHDPQNADFLGN